MTEIMNVHLRSREAYDEAVQRSLTYRDIAHKAIYAMFLEVTPHYGDYVAAEVPVMVSKMTPVSETGLSVFCRVDFYTPDVDYQTSQGALFSGKSLTLMRPLHLLPPHSGVMQSGVVTGDRNDFDVLLRESKLQDASKTLVLMGGRNEG